MSRLDSLQPQDHRVQQGQQHLADAVTMFALKDANLLGQGTLETNPREETMQKIHAAIMGRAVNLIFSGGDLYNGSRDSHSLGFCSFRESERERGEKRLILMLARRGAPGGWYYQAFVSLEEAVGLWNSVELRQGEEELGHLARAPQTQTDTVPRS